MDLKITPAKRLKGTISIPGDKSIAHRALLISSIADGTSSIESFPSAADPLSTLSCIRNLGIEVSQAGTSLQVKGKGLRGLRAPAAPLDCGNSGTTMRLLSAILCGQNFTSELIGDESLSRRPMKRIIEPLSAMGARISGTKESTAPLNIDGVTNLLPLDYKLPIPSAQVKSSVLFAGLYAEGTTRVMERTATRDHTERMLGLTIVKENGVQTVTVEGGTKIPANNYSIPGDFSSAAFLIAASVLVPNSTITLLRIGLNPTRTAVLDLFRSMGTKIVVENESTQAGEPFGDVTVLPSDISLRLDLYGPVVASLIDEIPILAVVAAVAKGSFRLRDAADLRKKESDRIAAIVCNLREMGVEVEESEDGFAFENRKTLIGTAVRTFGDHRIAMAFGVAGLFIPDVVIQDAECADVSFPGFWQTLTRLSS
jgi:3-phosphoshikimate 1-carboxyvinyltransferase